MQFVGQSVEFWGMTPDPVVLIERAGRKCYLSEPKQRCEQ
jgi:hypothetical protein